MAPVVDRSAKRYHVRVNVDGIALYMVVGGEGGTACPVRTVIWYFHGCAQAYIRDDIPFTFAADGQVLVSPAGQAELAVRQMPVP